MKTYNIRRGGLDRQSPFSYTCNRCLRCCHWKRIQVNPYEVARLAENQRMSTGDFIARFVEEPANVLRQKENGACAFLGAEGCTVHQDRPLVCRLYPLGRQISFDGVEQFVEVAPHPETEGDYGDGGTVDDYLKNQGIEAYVEFASLYIELFRLIVANLQKNAGGINAFLARVNPDAEGSPAVTDSRLAMDVDYALEYAGVQPAADAGARALQQIEFLQAWLSG